MSSKRGRELLNYKKKIKLSQPQAVDKESKRGRTAHSVLFTSSINSHKSVLLNLSPLIDF
jgi:hypothetical protein